MFEEAEKEAREDPNEFDHCSQLRGHALDGGVGRIQQALRQVEQSDHPNGEQIDRESAEKTERLQSLMTTTTDNGLGGVVHNKIKGRTNSRVKTQLLSFVI